LAGFDMKAYAKGQRPALFTYGGLPARHAVSGNGPAFD